MNKPREKKGYLRCYLHHTRYETAAYCSVLVAYHMCNMRQPLFPPSDMRPGTNMGLMVSYYTNYSVIQDQIFILPDYSHINLRFCCFPSPNVDLIYSYLTHYPHCWHHPQSVLCNPPLPPQHCFISYPFGFKSPIECLGHFPL